MRSDNARSSTPIEPQITRFRKIDRTTIQRATDNGQSPAAPRHLISVPITHTRECEHCLTDGPDFFAFCVFGTIRGACVKCAERAESIAAAGQIRGTRSFLRAEVPIMEYVEPEPRLSQMTTHWTAVIEAHSGTPDQVKPAVSRLMCRYAGAVHRYCSRAWTTRARTSSRKSLAT